MNEDQKFAVTVIFDMAEIVSDAIWRCQHKCDPGNLRCGDCNAAQQHFMDCSIFLLDELGISSEAQTPVCNRINDILDGGKVPRGV